MFVIARNVDDALVARLPDGRTMQITVQQIETGKRKRVRLAFELPDDVDLWRAEELLRQNLTPSDLQHRRRRPGSAGSPAITPSVASC